MPPPRPSVFHPAQRHRWPRIALLLLLIAALIAAAAACALLIFYGHLAEQYDLSKLGAMRRRSIVLDCRDREIGRLHGENRAVVPLSMVSVNFTKALLAREDARFHEHRGVDWIGVARAIVRDLREKRAAQGASTISMQLARNSFEGLGGKTIHRKLVEVMLARRIEAAKSKDEILELYVNRIFFGSGLYGIERASRAYFGKSAAQLSPGEGAMLAGIIRSPNRFSPFRNWNGALAERDAVLARMVVTRQITRDQAETIKREDMAVAAQPVVRTQESYVMEAVRRDLDLLLDEEEIEDGGLLVHTTIDRDVQAAAEQSLERRLRQVEARPGYPHPTRAQFAKLWDGAGDPPPTPYLQGAVVALDNDSGGILAIVGGRDFLQSRYDRALQAGRQIGSTIKPFIYAAAFLRGLLPGTLVEDAPIRPGELRGCDGHWTPENSDGKFLGWTPAAEGLVRSRNAMTVRVGDLAGMDTVLAVLREAGIVPTGPVSPQIYIGNTGATLKALTSAMSVFPNNGLRRRPFLIARIEDDAHEVIYETPVLESEVLPPAVAQVTDRLLQRVMSEGTGASARGEFGFKEPAGGKTGTTNDYHDAWFAGYAGEVTCGVWVGFDQPRTILEGAYGAKLALPVWVDVMKAALAQGHRPDAPRAAPLTVTARLCRVSGQLATTECASRGHAYEDDLPAELAPQVLCGVHGGGVAAGSAEDRKPGFFSRLFRWLR